MTQEDGIYAVFESTKAKQNKNKNTNCDQGNSTEDGLYVTLQSIRHFVWLKIMKNYYRQTGYRDVAYLDQWITF